MPTRIRGVVLSDDGRTPQSGIPMQAHDPSSGFTQGSATTDINGQFVVGGLEDRAWVARRVSGSTSIIIQEVKETLVEEEIHGQRSNPGAHAFDHLRNIPTRFNVGVQDEGVLVGERTQVNFAGAGVTAVDDPTNDRVTVTIPAGMGAHAVLDSTVHTDTLTGTVVLGDIIHGNATPAWARLAGNTTTAKQFLTQTGSGAASAVPAWFDLFGTANTFSQTQTFSNSVSIQLGDSSRQIQAGGGSVIVCRVGTVAGTGGFDVSAVVGGEIVQFRKPTNGSTMQLYGTASDWFISLDESADSDFSIIGNSFTHLAISDAGRTWTLGNPTTPVVLNYATSALLSITGSVTLSGTFTVASLSGVLLGTSGVVSAITTGTNGQVLTVVAGVPAWAASAGGASALNDLSDVVITAAATDDFLKYDGANWVDFPLFATGNTWSAIQTFTNGANLNGTTLVSNATQLRFGSGNQRIFGTSPQLDIVADAASSIINVTSSGTAGVLNLNGTATLNLQANAVTIASVATGGVTMASTNRVYFLDTQKSIYSSAATVFTLSNIRTALDDPSTINITATAGGDDITGGAATINITATSTGVALGKVEIVAAGAVSSYSWEFDTNGVLTGEVSGTDQWYVKSTQFALGRDSLVTNFLLETKGADNGWYFILDGTASPPFYFQGGDTANAAVYLTSTNSTTARFGFNSSSNMGMGIDNFGSGTLTLTVSANTLNLGIVGGTIAVFGVTAAARQGATTDIKDALTTYGWLQGTSASPLNLDGGQLTCGTCRIGGDILDNNGATFIAINEASSAVNYFSMTNSATGTAIALRSAGSDANVDILIDAVNGGGTSAVKLAVDGNVILSAERVSGLKAVRIASTTTDLFFGGASSPDMYVTNDGHAGASWRFKGSSSDGRIDLFAQVGNTGASPTYARVGGMLRTSVTDTNLPDNDATLSDMHTYAIPSKTLGADGDHLEFEFAFAFSGSAVPQKRAAVVFNATTIYDSGASAFATGALIVHGRVIRINSTTVRITAKVISDVTAFGDTAVILADVTGLNLDTTSYTLKTQGASDGVGEAVTDVKSKYLIIFWRGIAT